MSWLHGVRYALRSVLKSARSEQEREEEYEFHRAMERARLQAHGVTPAVARQHVDSEFGWRHPNVPAVRWHLDSLFSDVRAATRALRRAPAYTVTTIISVVGAIVGAALVSAILGALFVNPLPFPDDDRLVVLTQTDAARPEGFAVSLPNFRDWQSRSRSFLDMAAWESRTGAVSSRGVSSQSANIASITGSFFKVLGVSPVLGRTITEADENADEFVVVLSHRLWQQMFGGDSSVVGRQASIDYTSATIIGVMPSNVRFPASADVWLSWPKSRQQYVARNAITEQVIARLAPGASVQSASREVRNIASALHVEYPDLVLNQATGAFARSLREQLFGEEQSMMLLLGAAVAFVGLVVCLNLACAGFARAIDRTPEMALRAALGASRWRMVQTVWIESSLLVLLGAIPAIALSPAVLTAVWRSPTFASLQSVQPRLDAFAASVVLVLALLIVLAAGVWPALRVSGGRTRVAQQAGRGQHASPRANPRSLLLGLQAAVATMLLVAASLAVSSMLRIFDQPKGFDEHQLLTIDLRLPTLSSRKNAALMELVLDSMRSLPGVMAAGAVNYLPLTADPGGSARSASAIAATGRAARISDGEIGAGFHAIDGDYFAAMRITLLAGRTFRATDDTLSPRVAVVSASMARRFWPNDEAIGQTFRAYGGDSQLANRDITVVGVVNDVRAVSLEEPQLPDYYVSFRQRIDVGWHRYVVVRSSQPPEAQVAAIRRQLSAIDPRIAADFAPMETRIRRSLARRLFASSALGAIASSGLLLVLVGVYGVVTYAVAARRWELGLRIALGATSAQLLASVVRTVMIPVSIGVLAGVCGSLLLDGVLRQIVFGLSPRDPGVIALSAGLLIATSLLAGLIPARRAVRINPIDTLRAG